jgi:hypothetical protein
MALSKRNPLIDYDFLKRLDNEKQRETFAKIIALDWDENPLEEITGRVTQGSASIDGSSAVRRTCSVTLVAEELNIHDYYWGLNTKFKLSVGLRNNIDDRYDDIIWFPLGTYVISSFSTAQATNNYTVNIQGKDKMCLLNGELGGIVNALTWDFGSMDEIGADGTITNKKILLKDIIIEAVHEFAKEPYHNIIVNDLDTFGVELMEYRGKDPMYLLVDQNTLEVKQMTLDGSTAYNYYKREKSENWTRRTTRLDELEKQVGDNTVGFDNIADAAYDTGTDRLSVETNHILLSNSNHANGESVITYPIYSVIKASYGNTIGYRVTDLTYAGDLIAQVGNPITSAVLDKIKSMLGEFEYFYDIDGRFIFQKKKTYISSSYSGSNVNDDGEQWFNNVAETSAVTYYFEDAQIITSFNNQPNLANLRNDFSIWGTRKSVSGNEIPVHMRYAIDRKPQYYTTYDGSVTYTTRTKEQVEWDMKQGYVNVAVGYQKTPNPIFAEGKLPLPEDWWDARDWAEYYKECTGDYPKNQIGKYSTQHPGINLKNYFNSACTIDGVPSEGTLSTARKTDTIFTINGMFYSAHGLCSHYYEQHLLEWQAQGQQIFIYKPELPEEILEQEGVQLVPLGAAVKYECEWRELIYQMARDNMSFGHRDNFVARIAQNNPYHYPSGQTGYEQYYTDMLSFWRQIYNPSYMNSFEEIHLAKSTFDKNKTKYWKASRCTEDTPYADGNWLKKVGVDQATYDTVEMTRTIWETKLTPQERTHYYRLIKCVNTDVFDSKADYFAQKTDDFITADNGIKGWSKEVALYPEMLNFWFDFLDAKDGDLDKYSVQNVGIRPKAENDTNVKAIYFRDTPNVIFVDSTKIAKSEKKRLIEFYGSEQEWRIAISNAITNEDILQYLQEIGKTSLSNQDRENLISAKQTLELNNAVNQNIQDQKEEMPGYTFIRLPTYMENMFSISAQGKSAFDKLDNWLYSYACCTESISISSLPVYYLQPNTRIFVKDANSNIEGEYIISRISLPLTYNGMMSISATKAVQRLY